MQQCVKGQEYCATRASYWHCAPCQQLPTQMGFSLRDGVIAPVHANTQARHYLSY